MIQQLFHLMNNENLRLKTEKISFAAQKNDMLLRNMICLASPNVIDSVFLCSC